ncbi:MAG: hypothetical protein KGD70_03680 [Candidatus Lokiarchaeota archaeon]|nr:hypothetical protein [Candidatus Lokiarchaeota archaeon]
MIHDFLIIKDGLPLLFKNFSIAKNIFSESDSLIMVSGFFSALNSFSDSFEDLGTISELKLSNNELKLSFLKDSSIPNLIYIATYDEKSKPINVLRILRKLSRTFLQKFSIDDIVNWKGNVDAFTSFNDILTAFVEEELKESDTGFKERVVALFKCVEEKINEETNLLTLKSKLIPPPNLPNYCNQIPRFTSLKKINPKYYLTGETSHKVFYQIDGKKSIRQITESLDLKHVQVYNICKNLIKLGLIHRLT